MDLLSHWSIPTPLKFTFSVEFSLLSFRISLKNITITLFISNYSSIGYLCYFLMEGVWLIRMNPQCQRLYCHLVTRVTIFLRVTRLLPWSTLDLASVHALVRPLTEMSPKPLELLHHSRMCGNFIRSEGLPS